MSGLNIQRLRDIFDDVYDSLNGTLKTGGAQTIILGIFRATGAGTGYSVDDIIILRQTPPDAAEYFNATTGAVIATPDPADLGSVSSASNVSVLSSALPTGASTSALQTTGNTSLGSIDAKLPASVGAKASTGSLSVTQAFAATSTLANITAATSSTTLLAANNARKTAIIVNDSTATLYINLNGSVASTTNYSVFLPPIASNVPSQLILKGEDYSGEIRGIWSAVNGAARVTEIV